MAVLLDAGTLAAAVKGRLPVVLELARFKPTEVATSVICQMQLESGLRLEPRAQARYGKLAKELLATIRIIDFGQAEGQQASQLAVHMARGGDTLGGFELILAATALTHGMTLITDDTRPYLMVPGLSVENWLRPIRATAAHTSPHRGTV